MMKGKWVLFVVMAALVSIPVFAQDPEPVSNTDSPSGAAGDLSIQFKGVSSVGADDPDGLLNIIEGPITMEVWVKLDDYNGNWTGMSSWGFSYKLGISDDGQFIFTFFGIVDIFSGYDITPLVGDDQWHHFAAAWTPGSGVQFYVDGADVGFVEETRAPQAARSPNFTVGGEDVGKVPITASMDRMRVHNAALTADQLDSDAANPKAPLAETLVSYDFNEAGPPYKSSGSAQLDLMPQNEVAPSAAGVWEIYP
ncbi:MAG: LamG domain-containing protein [Candidatus Omnitrophica bacterium]|nr:LamG domain-containing protein [Candidatus Omnitrophota bacterium]